MKILLLITFIVAFVWFLTKLADEIFDQFEN